MNLNKNQQAFFALLRAGLWEQNVRLSDFEQIDYSALQELAEEQSVVGLVAAGMEHVEDIKIPKQDLLQFVGQTLQIEEQNKAMNCFIGVLVDKMRKAGIYTLLFKGQGIAQCYEKPLWRSCGDVDFFLNDDNYEKAKAFLTPFSSKVENEYSREKHLGIIIDPWVVELHGRLYCGLSSRVDKELDNVYKETFYGGSVRSLNIDSVQVFMLSAENDAFYVFTHILQHFYKGGIGLRQICDWCRLLWMFEDKLDVKKLKQRIESAGLKTAWMTFGAFAVEFLGMPAEAMPLYSPDIKWKRKAKRIKDFVMASGNFGQNRDSSYYDKYPYVIRKVCSMGRRIGDLARHARIFPWDSIRFFPSIMINGLQSAFRGE